MRPCIPRCRCIFLWPILGTGSALGTDDWDALLFQHGAVFKAVFEYAQLPFWNPWYCAGNVLWQNPQTPLLSPVYAIAPLVGVPLAVKIVVLLHYLAGFAGMHVLLRRGLGVTSIISGSAASMFTLGGGAALHLAVGHLTFLPVCSLPWILWMFIEALSSGSVRSRTGACSADGAGGVERRRLHHRHDGGLRSASSLRSRLSADATGDQLAMLAFVGVLMVLASAPKLLPQALIFAADPRKVDIRAFPAGPDVMSLEMLRTSFLEPFQFRRMRLGGMKYGWASTATTSAPSQSCWPSARSRPR